MKNIIKKIICSLCLGMIMTGCSGVTDYRIILNNDYYIAKTSANNAKIFKIEDKDITGRAPSIPVYNKENDEDHNPENPGEIGQTGYAHQSGSTAHIIDIQDTDTNDLT